MPLGIFLVYKGDNFCDFLFFFVSAQQSASPRGRKFCPFGVGPFQKGGKIVTRISFIESIPIPLNPCPAESGCTLPLQIVLKKPTDLDLHCLPLSMRIYSNNPDQVI